MVIEISQLSGSIILDSSQLITKASADLLSPCGKVTLQSGTIKLQREELQPVIE